MATAVQTKLMTAEEFMAADLGEGTFELVRGEVVEVPPTMPKHGRVCSKTGFVLESFGRQIRIWLQPPGPRRGDQSAGPTRSAVRMSASVSQAHWPESEIGDGLPPVPPDSGRRGRLAQRPPRRDPPEDRRVSGGRRSAGLGDLSEAAPC